jgi:single-stranded-DNA-specific exonuclease
MKDALGLERIWKIKKNTSDLPLQFSGIFNLNLLTAQILVQRGCDTREKAEKFLSLKLRDLSDPFLLTDMHEAVNRVLLAVEKKEKILVHGDYDVDGITGTAILCDFFRQVGVPAEPYIPDRVSEGYGISREAIEKAAREKFGLMISVDCGGSAFEEIDLAVERGLDFIVVDHHDIKEKTPRCLAFIHPRRTSQKMDFDHLAAVGTAFKLLHGIFKKASEKSLAWAKEIDLKDYLDRVALGTIADLVPLKGENKIYVKAGLEKLKNSKSPGLRKLLKIAKLEGRPLTPVDIGFKLAPRLNAAGRVGTAYDAVHLLLTQDEDEAERLAKSLDEHNRHRQTVEQETYAQALHFLSDRPEMQGSRVLVLSGNEWPLGVIGIVASRIVRLKYRPTFVLSEDLELCK